MNENIYTTPKIAEQLAEQQRRQMDETTQYPTGCAEYKPRLSAAINRNLMYAGDGPSESQSILSRIAQLEQRAEVVTKDLEESTRQLFQRVERIERALGL
jgi:hypothetical protein